MNEQQRSFYLAMTTALKAMREDPLQAAWGLVGLSFIYGIFHAVGPGHGKAVISSYMIANETALRRGISCLSFHRFCRQSWRSPWWGLHGLCCAAPEFP